MCIKETCFNANLFPVKITEIGSLSFLNIKVCPPPPGPSNSFILYTYMVYSHNICKWEAGSIGEHTSKLKMVMTLFFKYLTGNKFALIDITMIRMRNKIKSKLIYCNNSTYGWFYGKKFHPKR